MKILGLMKYEACKNAETCWKPWNITASREIMRNYVSESKLDKSCNMAKTGEQ